MITELRRDKLNYACFSRSPLKISRDLPLDCILRFLEGWGADTRIEKLFGGEDDNYMDEADSNIGYRRESFC